MATIGSITVAFDTDISLLRSGILEVEGLLESISSSVGELSSSLDAIADKSISVTAIADASQVESLAESINSVADKTVVVSTDVDTTAIDSLTDSVTAVSSESVSGPDFTALNKGIADASGLFEELVDQIEGFAESLESAFDKPAEVAVSADTASAEEKVS